MRDLLPKASTLVALISITFLICGLCSSSFFSSVSASNMLLPKAYAADNEKVDKKSIERGDKDRKSSDSSGQLPSSKDEEKSDNNNKDESKKDSSTKTRGNNQDNDALKSDASDTSDDEGIAKSNLQSHDRSHDGIDSRVDEYVEQNDGKTIAESHLGNDNHEDATSTETVKSSDVNDKPNSQATGSFKDLDQEGNSINDYTLQKNKCVSSSCSNSDRWSVSLFGNDNTVSRVSHQTNQCKSESNCVNAATDKTTIFGDSTSLSIKNVQTNRCHTSSDCTNTSSGGDNIQKNICVKDATCSNIGTNNQNVCLKGAVCENSGTDSKIHSVGEPCTNSGTNTIVICVNGRIMTHSH